MGISALEPGSKFRLQMGIFPKQGPKLADYWLGDLKNHWVSFLRVFLTCSLLFQLRAGAHGVSLCAARPSQRSASSPHVTPDEIRRCPLKGLCVCCCLHAPASGTKGVYISPSVFMLLEQLPAQHIWSLDSGFQVTEYFQRTDN